MKKILVTYAAYNYWANQRLTSVAVNLSDDQLHKDLNNSFSSVFLTLTHLWNVESIWWQRVKLSENVIWPAESFNGSVVELSENLVQQSKQWKEWIDMATEQVLTHVFMYKNSKKDQFKQPVYEVLHHLFNHQTFHRGQLITMLRQVGSTELPNTDLISFYRKK